MMIDIDNYILPLINVDLAKILRNWTWLTGNKSIVALTKAGDALLKEDDNSLYFLDIGVCELSFISKDYHDFLDKKLSEDIIDKLLLPNLIDKLEHHNINLKTGQVYSYTLLPILGGVYDEKNRYAVDLYEHYSLMGEINYKLKDLPDGTDIQIQFEN
jgi:Domain of unknown function (DUF1851)